MVRRPEQTVGDYFDSFDFDDSDLLVVPGTADRGAATLLSWMDFIVERFPDDRRHIIDYPTTIGPAVGGIRAPGYDESKGIGAKEVRESLARTTGRAVVIGYSQGADAVWDGVRQAIDGNAIAPEDLQVILWGHPRRPGGLKDVLSRKHRVVSKLCKVALGAEMDGAWEIDSRINVTSLAIEGDPITTFPPVWSNPLRYGASAAAGYFMLHSGMGYEGAAQLAKLPVARIEKVPGSTTTYIDASTADPMEQLRAYIQRRWQNRRMNNVN